MAAERAVSLGVRGEFTAECLEVMGIKNYRIIGCPSFYKHMGGILPEFKNPTSEKSVITCNNEPIEANKAVAYYFSLDNKVHYIYDTGHSALTISEPFLSIYNSGQIWKFSDYNKVKEVYDDMEETLWQGTNLVFIEKYFNSINHNDTEIIKFSEWINCNTVEDFRKIKE